MIDERCLSRDSHLRARSLSQGTCPSASSPASQADVICHASFPLQPHQSAETSADRRVSVNTCCVCVSILTRVGGSAYLHAASKRVYTLGVCACTGALWDARNFRKRRRRRECEIRNSCSTLQRSLSWNNSLTKVTLPSWSTCTLSYLKFRRLDPSSRP